MTRYIAETSRWEWLPSDEPNYQPLHIRIGIKPHVPWGVGAQILAAATALQTGSYCSFEFGCHQSEYKNYFPWYFEENEIHSDAKTVNLHCDGTARTVVHKDSVYVYGVYLKGEGARIILNMKINSRLGNDYVMKLRRLARRFLKLNQETLDNMSEIKNQRTLAVHYRGTDKYQELSGLGEWVNSGKDLSKFVATEEPIDFTYLFNKAKKMCYDLGLKNIMFFTDDEHAANLAKSEGFEVLDRRRSIEYGTHYAFLNRKDLDDAVEDLVYMGMADYLLLGRSCYSSAALILAHNLSLGYKYYD